jgi:Photoprotection regulator fluorescence recovery protein
MAVPFTAGLKFSPSGGVFPGQDLGKMNCADPDSKGRPGTINGYTHGKEHSDMESLQPSSAQYRPINMHEVKWSPSEKSIARRVFDTALQRELDATTQEVKQMADRIKTPFDLWALEDYLTQGRKEIDRKFDYRYSVLPIVFAQLILVKDGRITHEELHALAEDKLGYIRLDSEFRGRKPL